MYPLNDWFTFNGTRCLGFLVMLVPVGLLIWAIFDAWAWLPLLVAFSVLACIELRAGDE